MPDSNTDRWKAQDWKNAVADRLAELRIDPAREMGIIEELCVHLEEHYEDLLQEGVSEAIAREKTLHELRHADLLVPSLGARDHAPLIDPPPPGIFPSGNVFGDFLRDLRFAWRGLRGTPAFSFFAIFTLALGIGANTTVFTVINTLILHPLPVKDSSQLVAVYSTQIKSAKQTSTLNPISYPDLVDYLAKSKGFSRMAAFTPPMVMTLTSKSQPERIFGQLVTRDYFQTLSIQPSIGRFFLADEVSVAGRSPVAVLSYGAWKAQFGGDNSILGQVIGINGAPFTVVGVGPRDFIGVSAVFGPDVWLPATIGAQVLPFELRNVLTDRDKPYFHAIARLGAGIVQRQAQAEMSTLAASLARQFPETHENFTATVRPITDELFSNNGGQTSMVMGSAVLFVIVSLLLLIACSNVANLLLARAMARGKEIAVRLAVGASRGRLIRQMLTESMLLGLLGGIAGLAVGYEGCQLLWSFRPAEVAHNLVSPRLDIGVFAFSLLLSIVTGVLFGIVPAIRASRVDVNESLKSESRSASRSGLGFSFSNVLLVGQVAFSLLALVVASLFLRGVQRAYKIDPGFDANHLAVFMMNPSQAGYDAVRTKAFYRAVKERVSAIPGVAAASWATNLPFWSNPSRGVTIPGHQLLKKSEQLNVVANSVYPGYFDTMRIPVLQGRVFTEDDRDVTNPVTVINETMARRFWPDGGSLGRVLQLSGESTGRRIVGVVRAANYTTLGEAPQPCVYIPALQNYTDAMTLYVRAERDPSAVLAIVGAQIRSIAPEIQVSDMRTGSKIVSQVLFGSQIMVTLLGVFGSLGLALASVGLYGLMTYSVSRRRHEIGVRVALGAERSRVLRMVLRQGMTLVGIGAFLGLGASLAIGALLTRALYGISSSDPISLSIACAVLLSVALLACYLPARKASKLNPIDALRQS